MRDITVDLSAFRAAHHGGTPTYSQESAYDFQFGRGRTNWRTPSTCIWREAKALAIAEAKKRGTDIIRLQPLPVDDRAARGPAKGHDAILRHLRYTAREMGSCDRAIQRGSDIFEYDMEIFSDSMATKRWLRSRRGMLQTFAALIKGREFLEVNGKRKKASATLVENHKGPRLCGHLAENYDLQLDDGALICTPYRGYGHLPELTIRLWQAA